MPILTRVSAGGADFPGNLTNWSLSANDGRYLLVQSDFQANAFYRYDIQTGGVIPSAFVVTPGHAIVGGADLSGDGRYASSAQSFRLGFVYLQDLETQTTVFSSGTSGANGQAYTPREISVAQNAQVIAYGDNGFFGNDVVVLSASSKLTVPHTASWSQPEVTGNALSGAAERVAFSTVGTVYYADVAGGASGFTQAPVAIAPGSRASISANARFVVFETASALVLEDTNNSFDIYRYDILTGTTALVSKNAAGVVGNSHSINAAVSADGRYVAFQSATSNLVPNDTNAVVDIFRKDLDTGEVVRVSVANDGTQSNGASTEAEISADGQVVTFQSEATNLVSEDGNLDVEVFRVALNGVRTVNGLDVTASESYQLQLAELNLTLAGTTNSFGYGNALNNAIVGDAFANTLRGLAGNDGLFGNLGADVLLGGVGDDRLDGGGGNDYLAGETGNDVILGGDNDDLMDGGVDNDFLDGGIGNDLLFGSDGTDQLEGRDGNDYLDGGNGDDVLVGADGTDQLQGGSGNDYVDGGIGNDVLIGNDGQDYLTGGSGGDYIVGGLGADYLTGGIGSDAFHFASPSEGQDTIADFSRAEGDHILLSQSGFGMSSLTDGFNFFAGPGPAPTSATPTLLYDTNSGILSYDADGSGGGAAVGIVALAGIPSLQTSDILLV